MGSRGEQANVAYELAAGRETEHRKNTENLTCTLCVRGGEEMKNILMTVMLLVVVVLLFNNIIAKDGTGTKAQIQSQGESANTRIGNINP